MLPRSVIKLGNSDLTAVNRFVGWKKFGALLEKLAGLDGADQLLTFQSLGNVAKVGNQAWQFRSDSGQPIRWLEKIWRALGKTGRSRWSGSTFDIPEPRQCCQGR